MIKWTKKKYAEELKKGYWDLEPHFYYWQQLEFFSLFRTLIENKMSLEDVKSAMYGGFVVEGKPIRKGFYSNFNLMSKILEEITKKNIRRIEKEVKK